MVAMHFERERDLFYALLRAILARRKRHRKDALLITS